MIFDLQNINLCNDIFSVRIKIVNNERVEVFNYLFKEHIINIDYPFESNRPYILIISIMQYGKQIIKNKYTFIYSKCDKYIDNNVILELANNNLNNYLIKKNIIRNINQKMSVNPIIMLREEDEDTISVYNNGNILLLKGNLRKLLLCIRNAERIEENIDGNLLLDNLNTLLLKGCIVSYE